MHCTGRCTIVLRTVGHWLVIGAGCAALAGALPRCAQLLRRAVARGAVGSWLVWGSALNGFYWSKLLTIL
jgi:hypothetical protein